MKRTAIASLLLFAAAARAASPATAPFTPGPDTTVVSGPLLPDGTIDYVAAINTELAKGVTPQNNAAVILFGILEPSANRDSVLAALNAKPAALAQPFRSVNQFATATGVPPAQLEKLDEQDARLLARPWVPADAPIYSAWLDECGPALALVRTAAAQPQCFVPWVPERPGNNWAKALPLMTPFRIISDALVVRAMRSAGANDIAPALDDLRTVRNLARLEAQGRTEISLLVSSALERRVYQAYTGMITSLRLTPQQLGAIEADLQNTAIDPPAVPPTDIELLLCPASAIAAVRGDAEMLAAATEIFTPDVTLDPGDLPTVDVNALLRAVHALTLRFEPITRLPTFEARQAAYKKIASEDPLPSTYAPAAETQSADDRLKFATTFLRRKPSESSADFASRLAWLFAPSPYGWERFDALLQATALRRTFVLLAIKLERYRQAHGTFPAALRDAAPDIDLTDPFSRQPLQYALSGDTFTLCSFGLNEKDDHGKEDDVVLTNAPPPPPPPPPPDTMPTTAP